MIGREARVAVAVAFRRMRAEARLVAVTGLGTMTPLLPELDRRREVFTGRSGSLDPYTAAVESLTDDIAAGRWVL